MDPENFLLKTDISKRKFGLDILRSISICSVLIIHTIDLLPLFLQKLLGYIWFDGVTSFFVLSGFLIGNILIRTVLNDGLNFKVLLQFWLNRWMRTLPPYYLILLLLITIAIITKSVQLSIWDYAKYFLFIQNFGSIIPPFFDASWSLSVEEWFYLLTPITIFICLSVFKLKPKTAFLFTIIFFLALGHFFRIYNFFTIVYDPRSSQIIDSSLYIKNFLFRTPVVTRLDSVVYGIIGAYCFNYYKLVWDKYKTLTFTLGIMFIYLIPPLIQSLLSDFFLIYDYVFSYTTLGVGILLLLPLLEQLPSPKGVVYKIITAISLTSYSNYLIHLSVINLMAMIIFSYEFAYQRMALFISSWIASFLLSALMYKYFELPCINIRARFKVR